MGQIGSAAVAVGLAHGDGNARQLHQCVPQCGRHLAAAAAVAFGKLAIHQHRGGHIAVFLAEGGYGVVEIHAFAGLEGFADIAAGHHQVIDAAFVIVVEGGEHSEGHIGVCGFCIGRNRQQFGNIVGIDVAVLAVENQLHPAVFTA